jgi:hypothetical protein
MKDNKTLLYILGGVALASALSGGVMLYRKRMGQNQLPSGGQSMGHSGSMRQDATNQQLREELRITEDLNNRAFPL